MKPCPHCGAEYADEEFLEHNEVSSTQDGSHAQQETVFARARMVRCPDCGARLAQCPDCGAVNDWSPAIGVRGWWSLGAFLLGGWEALFFRNLGGHRRVLCNKCQAVFGIRPPFAAVTLTVYWLLIAAGIFSLVALAVFVVLEILNR